MHHDRVIAPQSGAQQAAILGGNIIIVGYPEVDLHDYEFGITNDASIDQRGPAKTLRTCQH